MAEEKNNSELSSLSQMTEEALLIRPSGVSKPTQFEQLAYNYGANAARDGFDVRADGELLRFDFAQPVTNAAAARQALVAMARQARAT